MFLAFFRPGPRRANSGTFGADIGGLTDIVIQVIQLQSGLHPLYFEGMPPLPAADRG